MPDPVASSLATGESATATTACGFTAQASGTLLELNITADDYTTTSGANRPESSGWTLVRAQVSGSGAFFGQAKWWKIATGSETTVSYTILSASKSCWSILAITNIDGASPVNISNLTEANSSSTTVASTSPGTPGGSGRCITVASLAGSNSGVVFAGIGAPSNSFATINTAQTTATPGLINATCVLVGDRGTATPTTTATFGGAVTAQATGAIVAVYNGATAGAASATPGPSNFTTAAVQRAASW